MTSATGRQHRFTLTNWSGQLSAKLQSDIGQLERSVQQVDSVAPLDDQVRLDVQFGVPDVATHITALTEDADTRTLSGYAHLDRRGDTPVAHLAVHPQWRRQGIGTALFNQLTWLLDSSSESSRPLSVWAHGGLPGAASFAEEMGLVEVRSLWQMRRSLATPFDPPTYRSGISVRAMRPGRDDEAWVALNAAAFADHPEQGRMTLADLKQRMQQEWFDPQGFFVAERTGDLLGFHWTKDHSGTGASLGEVYVIGVHPAAQGLGLGKALTLTGLRHLQAVGLDQVQLYVESDNSAAVALYERLGFGLHTADVLYAVPR
ncbi:MAG: mycothiol synthase [Nocardioidaceae bacterium]